MGTRKQVILKIEGILIQIAVLVNNQLGNGKTSENRGVFPRRAWEHGGKGWRLEVMEMKEAVFYPVVN